MKFKEIFINFYIVFLLSGFLFVSYLPVLTGKADGNFNVFYRGITMALSLIVISIYLFKRKVDGKKFKYFFIFYILYLLIMLYDIFIKSIHLFADKSYSDYLLFAIGVVFIPCCAISMISKKDLKLDLIFKWTYIVIYFVLLLTAISRFNTVSLARDTGGLEIGILIYGQYGTTLALLSFYALFNEKKGIYQKLFYISGFFIGFVTIFLSASRSPFVALLLSIILFVVIKNKGKGFIGIGIFLGVFSLFFYDIMSFLGSYFNSSFLMRLEYAFETDNERTKLYQYGFNEFLGNPLLGNAFLIQDNLAKGSYPHNLFIEVLMATGVIGGALFLAVLTGVYKAVKNQIALGSSSSWICLLFIQFLIFSMFSNNIFSNNLLWMLLILTLLFYERKITGTYNSTING